MQESAPRGLPARTTARPPVAGQVPLPWRSRPALWSLLATALFLVGLALGASAVGLGLLLAVPLMLATAGLGWRAGAPLVPLGIGLLAAGRWRPGEAPSPVELGGLAFAMMLATAAGHSLFSLWHAAQRLARNNERRARLLMEAALELQQASDEAALFEAAPRLLADITSFTYAAVFAPDGDALVLRASRGWDVLPGYRLPLTSVCGRALRGATAQFIPDVRLDPDYRTAPHAHASGSELAVPIIVHDTVRAVLNVEHLAVDAFAPADRRVLEAFAHMVADVLERLDRIGETRRQISEQETVARLNQHLLRAEGAREAAAIALAELTRVLDLPASAVVSLRRGQLQPLAVGGSAPAGLRRLLQTGLPFEGLLRASWSGCRAELLDDALRDPRSEALARSSGVRALAIVPIANAAREVQALMLLADPRHPRAWSEADRRLIDIVAASLGVVLDRATLNQQLVAMLEVVRGLARADEPHELYARAAESVVRIVPGAEAASVLVRQADGLRYLGAYGYELPALARVNPISEEEERVWYRNGEEAYRRGVPRLARGAEIAALSAASAGELGPASLDAARVREIRANICVPISDHGTIVAVLNVDSMSSEDAFGRSALRLAEAFAQQVAVIVRQAQARESLRHSAVTDTLTGLGNREGFHRRLDLELQRARRYGHPLSLALLDLDNFKAVNDRLGHTRGDAALVQVAEVLRHEPRASDSAFRWGGDEFVVLLPELDRAAARRAAQRFAERIKGLAIDGLLLSASVGIASYPEDGKDREALLRRADDLMYRRKQSGQAGAAG